MGVLAGLGGGLAAAEVCAPLLLLCWLCCWPDDASSDTSSNGKHPKTPVVKYHHGRRSSELVPRRGGGGGSAADLHRPSTSGHNSALAAHRSHEELPRRCQLLAAQADQGDQGRYHSAPSVIDEVLHRRAWERSSRDLQPDRDGYITVPLQPDRDGYITVPLRAPSAETLSPESLHTPPRALPESSSIEDAIDLTPTCKKHHTNTKNGKGTAKELARDNESKEEDVTEARSFYIGDEDCGGEGRSPGEEVGRRARKGEEAKRALYKAKDAKQSFNESVRSNKTLIRVEEHREAQGFGPGGCGPGSFGPGGCGPGSFGPGDRGPGSYGLGEDRSGAVRHCEESRSSLTSNASRTTVRSVEPVGYEGAACYLSERSGGGGGGGRGGGAGWGPRGGRHASDGDILTPAGRPESGAFSESELELDLALLAASEEPPPYSDVEDYCRGKETAI